MGDVEPLNHQPEAKNLSTWAEIFNPDFLSENTNRADLDKFISAEITDPNNTVAIRAGRSPSSPSYPMEQED